MSEPQRAAADERPAADEDRHSEEALMGALSELREIAGDLFELSQVQIERARIGVRSGIFTAGLATWMYVACIATSIVATYFLLDGLSGGLNEWLGSRWAGRLGAGLTVLVVMGLVVVWLRAVERRANLKRLKRKFGNPEIEP